MKTMNQSAEIIEPGVIRFERLLSGTIEQVWAYLTESEKRGKWLASGEMELNPGGKVHLQFKHSNLSEKDDPIPEKYCNMENGAESTGRITAIDPPHLLSFTWGSESEDASEVTFELQEHASGVQLTLTHRRLPESEWVGVCSGWHTHLNILVEVAAGQPTSGFWRMHGKLEKEYQKVFGK